MSAVVDRMSTVPKADDATKHDWRVDPSQVVIITTQGIAMVRVGCANDGCGARGIIESRPNGVPTPMNPKTWRPFQWKRSDRLVEVFEKD